MYAKFVDLRDFSDHLNNSELLDDLIVLERSFTRTYLQTSAGWRGAQI